MHQDSKSSRQLFISSVGTKHMLTLLLSLSAKLLGSKGTSRYSDGCHTNGPSSLEIWICLEPLEVTVSGPSLRLQMLGKVDMIVLLCLLVCFAFAERAKMLSDLSLLLTFSKSSNLSPTLVFRYPRSCKQHFPKKTGASMRAMAQLKPKLNPPFRKKVRYYARLARRSR